MTRVGPVFVRSAASTLPPPRSLALSLSLSPPRRGYTLFEICLVLAILVVLAAIAYPSIESLRADFRVTAAGDATRAAWAQARAHAMNEGRPYRFAIVPNKGNYRVAPAGDSESSSPVIEDVLPEGVPFSTVEAIRSGALDRAGDVALPVGTVSPEMWVTVATFFPDGTARGMDDDDVTVTFYVPGARPLQVKLRGLTGTSTPQRLNMDGSTP